MVVFDQNIAEQMDLRKETRNFILVASQKISAIKEGFCSNNKIGYRA